MILAVLFALSTVSLPAFSDDVSGDDEVVYINHLGDWTVQAFWTSTRSVDMQYTSEADVQESFKLTFSYFLSNTPKDYQPGEIKFSINGIDSIKRGGKVRAITASDSNYAEDSHWDLDYDSTDNKYTFTYRDAVEHDQTLSGGFEMQWKINAREAQDGFTETLYPVFSTVPDGTANLPPLSFEYHSLRDIYNISINEQRLDSTNYENLNRARTPIPSDELLAEDIPANSENAISDDEVQSVNAPYTWYIYRTDFGLEYRARALYQSKYFVKLSIENETPPPDGKLIDLASAKKDLVVYDLNYERIPLEVIEDPATGEQVYGFYMFTDRRGTISPNDTSFSNQLSKDFIIGVNRDKITDNTLKIEGRLIPLFEDETEYIIGEEKEREYEGTLAAGIKGSDSVYKFYYGKGNYYHGKRPVTHTSENGTLINKFYEGQNVTFKLYGHIAVLYESGGSQASKMNIMSSGDDTDDPTQYAERSFNNNDFSPDNSIHFIQGDDYLFVKTVTGVRRLTENEYDLRSIQVYRDSFDYHFSVYVAYDMDAALSDYVKLGDDIMSGKDTTGKNAYIVLPKNDLGQYPKRLYVDIEGVNYSYDPAINVGVDIKFNWDAEQAKPESQRIDPDGEITNVSYMRLLNKNNENFAATTIAHYGKGLFLTDILYNNRQIPTTPTGAIDMTEVAAQDPKEEAYGERLYRAMTSVKLKSARTYLESKVDLSKLNRNPNTGNYDAEVTSSGVVKADQSGDLKKFTIYTKVSKEMHLGDLSKAKFTFSGARSAAVDEEGNIIMPGRAFTADDFMNYMSLSTRIDSDGNTIIAASFDFTDDPMEILTGADITIKYPVYLTESEYKHSEDVLNLVVNSYTFINDTGVQKVEGNLQSVDRNDIDMDGNTTEVIAYNEFVKTIDTTVAAWQIEPIKYISSYYTEGYVRAENQAEAARVDIREDETDTREKARYSYMLDFTTGLSPLRNIVIYDMLEPTAESNITIRKNSQESVPLESEWRGTVENVDVSMLYDKGLGSISVYYTKDQMIDTSKDSFKTSPLKDLSNPIWIKMTPSEDERIWKPAAGDPVYNIAVAIEDGGREITEDIDMTVIVNMFAPTRPSDPSEVSPIDKYAQNAFTTVCELKIVNQSDSDFTTALFPSSVTHTVLKETRPRVKVRKIDSQNGAALKGAVFTMYTDEQCTNAVPYFENLETNILGIVEGEVPRWGTYYLKEVKPPEGFVAAEPTKIEVDVHAELIEIDINNLRANGEVEFHKKDADDATITDVAGAKYELYNKSGQKLYANSDYEYTHDGSGDTSVFVTGDNGFTIKNLPWGTYYLKEVEPPQGYSINTQPITFVIDKSNYSLDNQSIKVEAEQKDSELTASIRITKSDASDSQSYLGNAWYNVLKRNAEGAWETVRANLSTNAMGELTVSGLKFGEYKFQEIMAPKGYELSTVTNPESVVLDAKTVGQTLTVTQTDRQKTGSARLSKSSNTDTPIAGAVFSLFRVKGDRDTESNGETDDILIRSGLKTNTEGYTDIVADLEWGEYYFLETKAVIGYQKDNASYDPRTFTINANNVDIMQEVSSVNYQIPGSIVLTKYKEDDITILPGAKFALCDKQGTEILKITEGRWDFTAKEKTPEQPADTDGRFEIINIPWGAYTLKETQAPSGYALAEPIRFNINAYNCTSVQELECTDRLKMCEIKVNKKIDEALKQFGDPMFIFTVTNIDTRQSQTKTIQLSPDNLSGSAVFSVPSGKYTIKEVNVSRYGFKSISVEDTTTINDSQYSINGSIASCDLTSSDDASFEVTYENELDYFDKFGHVTAAVNMIPVEKKITGISASYNKEYIPLRADLEESTYVIPKEDITFYVIYDDGTQQVIDSSDERYAKFLPDGSTDFTVPNGINNADSEFPVNVKYTDTIGGREKTLRTTFFAAVEPAKTVPTQRVVFNIDVQNKSIFQVGSKTAAANVVYYTGGEISLGTYLEPQVIVGIDPFSGWIADDGTEFANEGALIMYLNSHPEITVLNVTAQLGIKVKNFVYTGKVQEFIAPRSGYYFLEGWGASGGDETEDNSLGGRGAYTSGYIFLNAGQKLYLYVGQHPKSTYTQYHESNPGGWNGGGSTYHSWSQSGTGGGGATDFRLTKASEDDDEEWYSFDSMKSRIMVAAGGGGGSDNKWRVYYQSQWTPTYGEPVSEPLKNGAGGIYSGYSYLVYSRTQGGYGGELTGSDGKGSYYGFGATQTAGGRANSGMTKETGKFGKGGEGDNNGFGSNGGGGGWYGGGTSNRQHGGGGGGSSYVSGYDGCKAINQSSSESNPTHLETSEYEGYVFTSPVIIAGDSEMPAPNGGTEIGHKGDGHARITFVDGDMSYSATGKIESYTAPRSGYYLLEGWGAQGGDADQEEKPEYGYMKGGKGGYSYGTVYLNEGQNVYIAVGGEGKSENVAQTKERDRIIPGGFNGGGATHGGSPDTYKIIASGGGATHFALETSDAAGFPANGTLANYVNIKDKVLLVAGGGGGALYCRYNTTTGYFVAYGGCGGGEIGGSGKVIASGMAGFTGAEITGGAQEQQSGDPSQRYGTFGQGANADLSSGDSGGGGGWYGGSKLEKANGLSGMSGGGGSGHVNSELIINGATIGGDNEFASPTGEQETGHSGDGFAKITFIGEMEPGSTVPFMPTDDIQTFNVTKTGTYKLEVWGAQGGSVRNDSRSINDDIAIGGMGGYASGNVYLSAGDILYIGVGGAGGDAASVNSSVTSANFEYGNNVGKGGFNGGGDALANSVTTWGGGGGATHIALNNDLGVLSNYSDNTGDVLIVAGGGGGGGHYSSRYNIGGAGGGETGEDGHGSYYSAAGRYSHGLGGRQDGGGIGYSGSGGSAANEPYTAPDGTFSNIGSFGQGGVSGTKSIIRNGSGGGGGWYGGGTGYFEGSSGGGGSGYINRSKIIGSTAENISGLNIMPTHDGKGTVTGNSGDGFARITLIDY